MFDRKPSEREPFSWLVVAGLSGAILVTSPLVGYATAYARSLLGRDALIYLVMLTLATAAGLALFYLVRRGGMTLSRYLMLGVVTAVYVYLVLSLRAGSPAEAIHYVEYGILSLAVYRALSHRIGDATIYPASIAVGTGLGILDECAQWLIPGRYFDFRDIWLNFSAVVLMQVSIAATVRPKLVAGPGGPESWRRLCRICAVTVAALGLCHANTPSAVSRYATAVPALGFLAETDDVMAEYGYAHEVPVAGRFKSRYTSDRLRQLDRDRSEAVAAVLRNVTAGDDLRHVLRRHSVVTDPFTNEFVRHLRSRDYLLAVARKTKDPRKRGRRYAGASYENAILEQHFGLTLGAAGRVWPLETKEEAERSGNRALPYSSPVKWHVITRYTLGQAMWFFGVGVLVLIGLGVRLGAARRA